MLTGEHGIGFHACRRARLIWGASVRAYALCAVRVASRWRGLGSGSGQLALWERAVRVSRCGSIYRSSAHRCRLCIVLCMCTRQDAKTTASGRSVPKSLWQVRKGKLREEPHPRGASWPKYRFRSGPPQILISKFRGAAANFEVDFDCQNVSVLAQDRAYRRRTPRCAGTSRLCPLARPFCRERAPAACKRWLAP